MSSPEPLRPVIDQALMHVANINEIWPGLQEAIEPSKVQRTRKPLSYKAKAAMNELLRQERLDLVDVYKARRVVSEPMPVPINLNALDAQNLVADELDELAWRISSSLRRVETSAYVPGTANQYGRVTAALRYLASVLGQVDELEARHAARALDRIERVARQAAGVEVDLEHLVAACPACGRRMLEARSSYVLCAYPSCRCIGPTCPCSREGRQPYGLHVWWLQEQAELATLLNLEELRGVTSNSCLVFDGMQYVTLNEAVKRFGGDVTKESVYMWVNRQQLPVAGKHPHLNESVFRWLDVVEAEYKTRTQKRGRPRKLAAA